MEGSALRYLVISMPAFELERCGYRAVDPVVLVQERRGVLRVVSCTPAAARLGFQRGMTAQEARACFAGVPQVLQEPECAEQDRAALVETFQQVSDRVCAYRTDMVALEISRLRTHGGCERRVLRHTRTLTESLGHSCRLVIADHPRAAAALAECAHRDLVVPVGEGASGLADLPILALRPSASLMASWRAIGLTRIGGLAQLDPASVSGRYGREGLGLWHVARGGVDPLSGRTWGLGAKTPLCVSTSVEGVTSSHELEVVLLDLLTILVQRLASRGESLVRLVLTLTLDTGFVPDASRCRDVRLFFRVGRPTRSLDLWRRLIRNRLEVTPLEAPVERLVLEVLEQVDEPAWQLGLTSTVEAAEAFSEWLDRVQDRFADVKLFTPCPSSSWCPEEAWIARPIFEPTPCTGGGFGQEEDPVAPLHREVEETLVRPNRLLVRPLRIDVRVGVKGPDSLFFEESWRRIHRALGPERLTGGWWRAGGGWSRDYWRVGVQGRDSWIFCTLHMGWNPDANIGAWFLHGWFD